MRGLGVVALLLAACASPVASSDAASGDASGMFADAVTDARDGGRDAAPTLDVGDDAASTCTPRPYVGLFVWNDDLDTTRDAILDLAAGAGVTEIYLHANRFYVGELSETSLAAWIDAAHARCIDVDLLFGDSAWIHPAGRPEASARTAWAATYATAHPSSRPTGVHFDLEPQQLPEWSDVTTHPALVSELVDALSPMTPVAEAAGLVLSVDIGFFLDGVMVTRGGATRPGNEWVTDAVSRVVVMDYRDSAESTGHGGMISLAETEVTYAASVATPIVLAAETNPQTDTYVSFAEEGRAAMFVQLDLVRAHFAPVPAFVGVAIHDRDGLARLGP